MSDGIAGGALVARHSRRRAFARAIVIVLAWHVIPACEVILGNVTVAREPIGDSFDGLVLAAHEALLALSLLISVLVLVVLAAVGRRRPRLRRVAVLGNVSAATGVLLTVASLVWITTWVAALRAIH